MTLCSGLTYRGLSNKLVHAQSMNALIFDLDSVTVKELNIFMKRLDIDPNGFCCKVLNLLSNKVE